MKLLPCALLLASCAAPPDHGDPSAVLEPHGFYAWEVSSLISAADEWNARWGSSLSVAEHGNVQVFAHHWPNDVGIVGSTELHDGAWSIQLESDTERKIFYEAALHEIGHYLTGGSHSANPADVMFWRYEGQSHLTDADVSR